MKKLKGYKKRLLEYYKTQGQNRTCAVCGDFVWASTEEKGGGASGFEADCRWWCETCCAYVELIATSEVEG